MFEDVRSRVREQLQARNVDAYLAYTPSNLFYTTGFLSPVVALSWRLMGTDMALIPADPAIQPALIIAIRIIRFVASSRSFRFQDCPNSISG